MRSPRTLLAIATVAALLAPVLIVAATPTAKPGAKSAVKKKPTKLTPAQKLADSLRIVDSLRMEVAKAETARADSLHKLAVQARMDSLHRADSLRRADSLALAERTWFVAKVRDQSQSPLLAQALEAKLGMELERTGRAKRASMADPATNFEATWTAAKASGASKFLYTTLQVKSDGLREASSWVFDLASRQKIDSTRGIFRADQPLSLRRLTRQFVRAFRPSPSDSICIADSSRQSNITWGVAPVFARGADTALAQSINDSLVADLRHGAWATWAPFEYRTECVGKRCLDSSASAWGAQRVIHSNLTRLADSSLALELLLVRASDDSVLDSTRVLDRSPRRLAQRAMAALLAPASTCREKCRSEVRSTWVAMFRPDSVQAANLPLLSRSVQEEFGKRLDRQFLTIPWGRRADSTARALMADKKLEVGVTGSDSAWVFNYTITDFKTAKQTRSMLRRGGPRERVFRWAARRLAGLDTLSSCPGECLLDSLEETNATWALVPSIHQDPAHGPLLAEGLVERFLARKNQGRLLSLPDTLPCEGLPCLDSVASARSIQRLLHPTMVHQAKDSSWLASLWVRDARGGVFTDSLQLTDTGAPLAAASRMAESIWERLTPRIRCDSCQSRDTLESAIFFALPRWSGGVDTFSRAYRDVFAEVAKSAVEYQVLMPRRFDSLRSGACDSLCLEELRCRTGASFLVQSEVEQRKDGWTVRAHILDLTTWKIAASFESRDRLPPTPKRIREIAPWAARQLFGKEATAVAPVQPEKKPWGKILALFIPAAIGTGSMIMHW